MTSELSPTTSAGVNSAPQNVPIASGSPISSIFIARNIGSAAGDVFNYTFGGGTISLVGGGGNDSLLGEIGNDLVFGGNGNDAIFGGDGVDNLNGGAGDDTISGGAAISYSPRRCSFLFSVFFHVSVIVLTHRIGEFEHDGVDMGVHRGEIFA